MKGFWRNWLLAFLFVGAPASAVPLNRLIVGEALTIHGVRFDQWTVVGFMAADLARTFDPSRVDVEPALNLFDPLGSVSGGFAFSATDDELAVTGNGILNFLDLTFGFRVTAPPDRLFHSTHNELLGTMIRSDGHLFDNLGMSMAV